MMRERSRIATTKNTMGPVNAMFSYEISRHPMYRAVFPVFLAFVEFIESSRRTAPSHEQSFSKAAPEFNWHVTLRRPNDPEF